MRIAQKAANYILPTFVTTLIVSGIYASIFEAGYGWLYRTQNRPIWAAVYSAISLSMMLSNLVVYLRLVTHRPPSPPRSLPEELPQKSIIFECINERGELSPCHKDNCNGRLKTPRTHHCSVCGDCRMGFDHHCPWIGNCVTIEARKGFLAFLALTSVMVPWAVAGMWGALSSHIVNALSASTIDPHTRRVWWDNWYSWVVVGGPPGRWIVGLFLGLRITRRPSSELHRLGDMIRYPSVSLVVIAGCGTLFAFFTTVLALTTINDVLKGRTSLDAIAQRTGSRKGTLVWIPWREIDRDEDGGTVVATNAGIYNAGPRGNWDSMWNSDILVRSGTWRRGREDVAHRIAPHRLVLLRALALANTNRSIADS